MSVDAGYKPASVAISPTALLQVSGPLEVKIGYVVQPFSAEIHADVVKIGGNLLLDLGTATSIADWLTLSTVDSSVSVRLEQMTGDITIRQV